MPNLNSVLNNVFGSSNDRKLKKFNSQVDAINQLEAEFEKLNDKDLKNKTIEFKARILSGESLNDILVEAFAVVREAGKRTLGQRHFDVQLLGGLVLNQGNISEMKTGEGKTLVATLPVYLNALEEKGVHVVTVNDYLAKRDSEWMSQIYNNLGMTVGTITSDLDEEEKRKLLQHRMDTVQRYESGSTITGASSQLLATANVAEKSSSWFFGGSKSRHPK